MQTISLTIIKKSGGAISRVLSCAVICLARPSPDGSSGLPGARRAAVSLRFSLASDGACICPAHYWPGGSLLHCLFTLTCRRRQAVLFCCAFPWVTPAGRYPASCPVKPGLSSSEAFRLLRRGRMSRSPDCFYSLKIPPPMNSRMIEFAGTLSAGIEIT